MTYYTDHVAEFLFDVGESHRILVIKICAKRYTGFHHLESNRSWDDSRVRYRRGLIWNKTASYIYGIIEGQFHKKCAKSQPLI